MSKDNSHGGGHGPGSSKSDDGYIHKDDGTYTKGPDGKPDYHISSNPDADADDGTGRNSDGGNED